MPLPLSAPTRESGCRRSARSARRSWSTDAIPFRRQTSYMWLMQQGPTSKSLYVLLGIAGALVGATVADAVEFSFLGLGTVIGAILGAAFFVIGWRQIQAP